MLYVEELLRLKVIKVVEVSLNGSKFMPTNNQNCNVNIQTLSNRIVLVAVMEIWKLAFLYFINCGFEPAEQTLT